MTKMMVNNCAIQRKKANMRHEEMARDFVLCPKPQRAGMFNCPVRPDVWHMSHQADVYDNITGTELLDIIFSQGDGQDIDQGSYTHLSPFFTGSPPSRVSNPLIQDPRFVEVMQQQPSLTPPYLQNPTLNLSMSSSPSSSIGKGGFGRNNFGNNPAVRVEGFETIDMDHHNCSIPTIA